MAAWNVSKSARIKSDVKIHAFKHTSIELSGMSRKSVLNFLSSAIVTLPGLSLADDEDMTSQLFNSDGSLKEDNTLGVTGKLTFRSVSDTFSVDGNEESVKSSYILPSQWKNNYMVLYPDGVEAKACDMITVFKKPGKASVSELEKASMVGVGKTLGLQDKRFLSADIINGKKRDEDGVKYFDFDLAVAPPTCSSNDKENLGLGFCSYDSIVLLSAAVVNDSMFVFALECGKDEWKRSNSDLKLIRSSFKVESIP